MQDWFPLGLTGWITPRNSQELFSTPPFKSINSSVLSLPYGPILTTMCDYWKNHGLTICIFVGRVVSLLLNTLPRFVTVFLPRSKHLLISWSHGTGVRQGVVPTHGEMKRWAPDPWAMPLLWNLPPSCAPGTQPLLWQRSVIELPIRGTWRSISENQFVTIVLHLLTQHLHLLLVSCFHLSSISSSDPAVFAPVFSFLSFWPCGMWNFRSPTRDWTCTPCIENMES